MGRTFKAVLKIAVESCLAHGTLGARRGEMERLLGDLTNGRRWAARQYFTSREPLEGTNPSVPDVCLVLMQHCGERQGQKIYQDWKEKLGMARDDAKHLGYARKTVQIQVDATRTVADVHVSLLKLLTTKRTMTVSISSALSSHSGQPTWNTDHI